MGYKKFVAYLIIFVMFVFPMGNVIGQLTVGDFDDNLNYGYFLDYIDETQQYDQSGVLPQLNFKDRVTLRIVDENDVGISNAFVRIIPNSVQEPIIESYAGTNGVFYFFPYIDGAESYTNFNIEIGSPDSRSINERFSMDLDELTADRTIEIKLNDYESSLPSSLDLMFVVDTTGSMSDELNYLTAEFENIIGRIENNYPQVTINFGLVVYRDKGDDYVVKNYDFTDSLEKMQEQLSAQSSSGGGDYPEAMDQALATAVNYQWRGGNTARMLFLVADAPPHNNKLQATLDNVILARKQGIHIFPIAASGVADTAEYMMRTAACLTNGRYIFLTDDSGIGNPHAEPHIPGYVVTHLDDLFVRVVGSELIGKRIEAEDNEIIRRVGKVENGVVYPIKEVKGTNEQEVNSNKTNDNDTEKNENKTNSTNFEDTSDPLGDDIILDDDGYTDSGKELKSDDMSLDSYYLISGESDDTDYFGAPSGYPRDSDGGDGESKDASFYSYSNIPLFLLILIPVVAVCVCILVIMIVIRKNKKKRENYNIAQIANTSSQDMSKPNISPIVPNQNLNTDINKPKVQNNLNESNETIDSDSIQNPNRNQIPQLVNNNLPVQQPKQNLCTTCGQALTYYSQNNKYYCHHCQKYE
jgi:hypothetical protein